jgi:hypothetical protein
MYGGYEMVQQHLNHNLSHASKQHQFCIRLAGKVVAWLGKDRSVQILDFCPGVIVSFPFSFGLIFYLSQLN